MNADITKDRRKAAETYTKKPLPIVIVALAVRQMTLRAAGTVLQRENSDRKSSGDKYFT
jgi:hypothetical protein